MTYEDVPLHGQGQCQPYASSVEHVGDHLKQTQSSVFNATHNNNEKRMSRDNGFMVRQC